MQKLLAYLRLEADARIAISAAAVAAVARAAVGGRKADREENARLTRLVADQALDNQALKDLLRKNW